MFARFDENPAMTLQDIKETKRYRRTDGWMHAQTHTHTHAHTDNVKTVYPPQTRFAGGIKISGIKIGLNRYSKTGCLAECISALTSELFKKQLIDPTFLIQCSSLITHLFITQIWI